MSITRGCFDTCQGPKDLTLIMLDGEPFGIELPLADVVLTARSVGIGVSRQREGTVVSVGSVTRKQRRRFLEILDQKGILFSQDPDDFF